MSNQSAVSTLSFSVIETSFIRQTLSSLGLFNPNFPNLVQPTIDKYGLTEPSGLWAPLYSYIYGIITTNNADPTKPKISDDVAFWFQNAPAINANDTSQPSNNYIRGDTTYGLWFQNLLQGQSASYIANELQKTSNLIGEKVITELLTDGGIPTFPYLIANDISAAIGANSGALEQSIGGWGGSFYYWNAPLVLGDNGTTALSVGNAIVNGNPNGADALQKNSSLTEFYFDNSNASTDSIEATIKTALAGAIETIPFATELGPVALLLSPSFLKAVKDGFGALAASLNASAPPKVKSNLQAFVLGDLILRQAIGKLGNDNGYDGVQSVSTVGKSITTLYTDGSTTTQDFDDTKSNHVVSWRSSSGSGSFSFDLTNGRFKISSTDPDGTAQYAAIDSTGTMAFASGGLLSITDDGLGDLTFAGAATDTYNLQTATGQTETIRNPSGRRRIRHRALISRSVNCQKALLAT